MADQSTAVPSDLESYINKLDDALETTIRFFDRNGYFVVIGKDALFFADEIRKTKEILKPHSNGSIGCYAVVSPNQFESEIKEVLLVRQYRIEMHQKDEGVWYKAFDASPGNTGPLEEILYSSQDNLESRGLVAISTRGENNPFIGVVYVDDISKVISVAQFQDDANLSMLESFLVQFSPQEALFPDTTPTTISNFVITKLEMNRILPTSYSKEIFNAENGKDALPHILARKLNWDAYLKQMNQIFEAMPPTTRNLALESLSAVVQYLQMAVDTSTSNQYDIKEEHLGMYVKLDSSAVSSLNLFDSSREQSSRGDRKNLFSLLDHCRTPMGRRLLSLWIRQPIVDRKKIEERLNLVEQFVEEIGCRSDLNSSKLRGIPDLIQMARKFSNKTVKLGEIFRVYQVTRNLWGFVESLGQDNMYVRELLTKKFEKFVELFDNFNAMVEMLVDEDTTTREYQIKSSYDEELSVLRRELAQVEGHVSKIHRRVASELGVDEKKVKLHSDGKIGYYFSITNSFDKKLTEAMKHYSGYEILTNPKKDGIRFAHEDLSGINENFLPLLKDIDAKETRIMGEVRDIVSTYANLVKQLSDLIALVDVYVSLATAACMAPTQYVRPEILEDSGIIEIKKLRHPCVEQQESLCLDTPYIANDVELKDKKFLIITGPNMGGKSTYIRSIGIAVLMAQMGSFVPAEYAKISIVDGIYTRIGATDRQLLGNSTFMTEMVEMASILRSATNNSLIIIDELGRGTSTFDGFGIAYSVSKHIALELKSYCLFATHYHELTDLKKEVDSVGVLHVAVREPDEGERDGNITMLYQVRPGKSGRSYGVDVARAANFPADMISVAQRKLEELEASETLVNQLPVDDILKEVGELDLQGMSDEDVESFVSKIRNMIRA